MKDKKKVAKDMEKIEWCHGYHNYFPRDGMMKYSGSKMTMFCTKDCYKK